MQIRCPRCKQLEEHTEFGRNSRHPSGRQLWCRVCKRDYDRWLYRTDVRCANCHRRRTARQMGWYKKLRAGGGD